LDGIRALLVVGKDRDAVRSFAKLVGRWASDAPTHATTDAAEALRVLASRPVDLVVIAGSPSGRTMMTFLQEIRAISPGIPKLVLGPLVPEATGNVYFWGDKPLEFDAFNRIVAQLLEARYRGATPAVDDASRT
jgi:DNA-binding NtrC family response regulator